MILYENIFKITTKTIYYSKKNGIFLYKTHTIEQKNMMDTNFPFILCILVSKILCGVLMPSRLLVYTTTLPHGPYEG